MSSRIQSAAEMGIAFGGPLKSWTPTLLDSSLSAAEGQTYGANNHGLLTRVGNLVFFTGTLDVAGLGTLTTTDPAFIGGLLYSGIAGYFQHIGIGNPNGLSLAAATSIKALVSGANNYIQLQTEDLTTGVSNMLISEVSVTGEISVSGWYITNDDF